MSGCADSHFALIQGNYMLAKDTGTSDLNELKASFSFVNVFTSIYFYIDTRQYLKNSKTYFSAI